MTFNQWLSSLTDDDYNWYFAMYEGNMQKAYEEEYLREYKE